ncbi:hypothetical protein OnM2_104029 [Erysiphe neolycopersici]|uniref:Uncharacterized protein n=1 Tax=Erysiphe neolycopersici TaxID=212602 RepID=A0A420H7T9_9PEZI|nr:hypothetical protein OnM2_104029 [Erysiphe neolycopersici]
MIFSDFDYEMNFGKVDVNDIKYLSDLQLNGYIIWFIDTQRDRDFYGEGPWAAFQEAFNGWTTEMFLRVAPLALEALRSYLRSYGVFVPKSRGAKTAIELAKVVKEEKQQVWTYEELEDNHEGSSSKQKSPIWSIGFPHRDDLDYSADLLCKGCFEFMEQNQRQQTWRHINQQFGSNQQEQEHEIIKSRRLLKLLSLEDFNPKSLPQNSSPISSHTLNHIKLGQGSCQIPKFVEVYEMRMRYRGNHDFFEDKVRFFNDYCSRAGFEDQKRVDVFPIMLTGPTLAIYYSELYDRGYDVDTLISKIREEFEPEVSPIPFKKNEDNTWLSE